MNTFNSDYEFTDEEIKYFKQVSFQHSKLKRENKRQEMIDGYEEPIDMNFRKLKQGLKVFVTNPRGLIILGFIRMAKLRDSYIVENEDGIPITHEMLNPSAKITNNKPIVFDIAKPNHRMIFLSFKEAELHFLQPLFDWQERYNVPIPEILNSAKILISKYPEEFI